MDSSTVRKAGIRELAGFLLALPVLAVGLLLGPVELLAGGLVVFIIILVGVAALIIAGDFPDTTAQRLIRIRDNVDPQIDCKIEMTSETVFAVNQPITVEATLEAVNGHNEKEIKCDERTPNLTFPGATVDGPIDKLEFQREGNIWTTSGKVVYYQPGDHEIQYELILDNSTTDIGHIASERMYVEYRRNRYILLFGVFTAILAAGSLLLGIWPL